MSAAPTFFHSTSRLTLPDTGRWKEVPPGHAPSGLVQPGDNSEEVADYRPRLIWLGAGAITELKEKGGGIQDFERLMRGTTESDIKVMQGLTEWLDESGRSPEADQWLREAAAAGHFLALHLLIGRAVQGGRAGEPDCWRRQLAQTGTWGGVSQIVQQLESTDHAQAERLRRYGIEPGGATADPW